MYRVYRVNWATRLYASAKQAGSMQYGGGRLSKEGATPGDSVDSADSAAGQEMHNA